MYDDYNERDYEGRSSHKGILIVVCVLAFLAVAAIYTYNQLVEKVEDVKLAESNVENMMQRRLELIPDLVATVKDFTEHEEQVFRDIDNARATLQSCLNSADLEAIEQANKELTVQVENLTKLVVEDYPDLASSKAYIALMDQLEGSANRIAVAREDYNNAVSTYNRAIKRYPEIIYASIFGYKEIEPFKADEEAHQNNLVDFG